MLRGIPFQHHTHGEMTGQTYQGSRAMDQVPLHPLLVRRPKQYGVGFSSNDTGTEDISTGSSSVSSLYLDDDCPFRIQFRRANNPFLPCKDKLESAVKGDPMIELQRKQIDYWNRLVVNRSVALGPRHLRTAEALMDLGNAQSASQDYSAACRSYQSALKVFHWKYGDVHLSVARALDKVGLATSMTRTDLDSALKTLMDAWKIRCELLGPDHIDSVDSLNNVAGVHLNRREFAIAARLYRTVIRQREQIFGRCHASVAVTAYTLACVLEDGLDQGKNARAYFNLAKDIYSRLGFVKSPHYVDACSRLKELSNLLEI